MELVQVITESLLMVVSFFCTFFANYEALVKKNFEKAFKIAMIVMAALWTLVFLN